MKSNSREGVEGCVLITVCMHCLWNVCSFLQLCVHVGVHGLADSVQLEECAHNDGYNRPDECGKKCLHCCCVDGK